VNHAASEQAPAAPVQPDGSTRAGRGILSITGAKLYFLVAGYAAQLLLPRLLASPEAFGFFSTAMSFVSIVNGVLINATIQAVSKRVSEDPARAAPTLRQALELQLLLGGLVAASVLVLAPVLAGRVLLDPLLTPLFRLSAIVIMSYALYAAMIGALNGRQQFRAQARFDMSYTTLRTAGMLGAASVGLGAVGVFAGFALATSLVMLAATLIVGIGSRGQRRPWRSWLSFMAPLWLYQLCLNLILQVDVTLLKRTVAEILQHGGTAANVAAETASRYVGFYRAAQTFAFVPYQLIISVAFVIFPMVSQALSLGDEDAARRYIRAALRFSLLVLLGIAAPFAGAASAVMRLVYPSAYTAGAPALAVLVLAMVAFSLFVISATVMTGAGRPGLAAGVAALAVGVVFAGNIGLVRYVGVGEHTLFAAASGTALGSVVAMLAMGLAVHRRFGAFLSAATTGRTLLAGAIAFAVAAALPSQQRWQALGALGAGVSSYALALYGMREVTRADLAVVLGMLRRRRQA
jgi:stage V sporulation protein B